jgi:hypothetical protein
MAIHPNRIYAVLGAAKEPKEFFFGLISFARSYRGRVCFRFFPSRVFAPILHRNFTRQC